MVLSLKLMIGTTYDQLAAILESDHAISLAVSAARRNRFDTASVERGDDVVNAPID
jgi:hypothetical protein